ncbi:hypothetical protein [Agrobacterium tumefaciens]|uniref:hypothetical protein n=1 Tax=Agrobacterium tumefaciens TaxID=358 RepID=UPI001572D600|nr:hypothetical protein [Agrobacterium tumefaciens]WCJ63878.1 hypothetical protein G6M15_06720 [Agrobacterium tumefaciens]
MAEAADNMTSEDPGALMKRILANRKSIAKAQFDMIANIGWMRSTMSDDDLRSFLVVECGIPRSDLPSIFAFDETLGPFETLLRKRCVPFHVVKALIATDADTIGTSCIVSRIGELLSFENVGKRAGSGRELDRRTVVVCGGLRHPAGLDGGQIVNDPQTGAATLI